MQKNNQRKNVTIIIHSFFILKFFFKIMNISLYFSDTQVRHSMHVVFDRKRKGRSKIFRCWFIIHNLPIRQYIDILLSLLYSFSMKKSIDGFHVSTFSLFLPLKSYILFISFFNYLTYYFIKWICYWAGIKIWNRWRNKIHGIIKMNYKKEYIYPCNIIGNVT